MNDDKKAREMLQEQGRVAYVHGSDPDDYCPYSEDFLRDDWMEGWNVAKRWYELKEIRRKKREHAVRVEESDFEYFADECPWLNGNSRGCRVTGWHCTLKMCGLWYLKKFMEG